MSWANVVRRDLKSVSRSRLGPAVVLGLLVSTVGVVGTLTLISSPDYPPAMRDAVVVVGSALSFVVPLAALLGSYSALVGERTTGSVRFLLGLPNSRDDAFVGKFVSRSLLVLAPLIVGTLGAAIVVVSTFENGSFVGVSLLGLVSVVYALFFVGVGMSVSAIADTDNQAVGLAVVAFVVFRVGWLALQWVGLQRLVDPYPRPEWYFWVGRLDPINAYVRLTAVFADIEYHPLLTTPNELQSFALTAEFAAVVLVCWTLAAPVAGLVYYRRRDLL